MGVAPHFVLILPIGTPAAARPWHLRRGGPCAQDRPRLRGGRAALRQLGGQGQARRQHQRAATARHVTRGREASARVCDRLLRCMVLSLSMSEAIALRLAYAIKGPRFTPLRHGQRTRLQRSLQSEMFSRGPWSWIRMRRRSRTRSSSRWLSSQFTAVCSIDTIRRIR